MLEQSEDKINSCLCSASSQPTNERTDMLAAFKAKTVILLLSHNVNFVYLLNTFLF